MIMKQNYHYLLNIYLVCRNFMKLYNKQIKKTEVLNCLFRRYFMPIHKSPTLKAMSGFNGKIQMLNKIKRQSFNIQS
jgi:hypothetical protein